MDRIDQLAYRFWSIHPKELDPFRDSMPEGYKGGVRAWFWKCASFLPTRSLAAIRINHWEIEMKQKLSIITAGPQDAGKTKLVVRTS